MDKRFGQNVPEAADHTVFSQKSALRMPLNLGEWVARDILARWVKEGIEKLDRSLPEVKQFFEKPPDVSESQSKATLSVLILAYVTQVFTTSEILQACQTDQLFQELCAGSPPSPEAFDRCRRQHRSLLEEILAQIMVRAVKEKYMRVSEIPPGLKWSLLGRASDRLDTAHLLDSCEECEQ